MAGVKDSSIERALRRIVRETEARKEEVRVKSIRLTAEKELNLSPGFLSDGDWKSKSRDIIREAFQQDEEGDEQEVPATTKTAISAGSERKDTAQPLIPKQKSKQAAETRNTATLPSRPGKGLLPNGYESGNDEDDEASNSDSDSDSEGGGGISEDSDAPEKDATIPAPQKANNVPEQVNGVKRKAPTKSSSTSADSSTSDPESDDEFETPAKKKARREDNEHVEDAAKGPSKASHSQSRTVGEGHSSTQATPTMPYRPPPGFSAVKASMLNSNDTLSTAGLEGKQIWHITAPSSIDPASLSNLTLETLQSSNPEITINGVKYAVDSCAFPSTNPETVMAPTSEGYKAVTQKIERSLTLKQKIDLPNLSAKQASQMAGSSAAADIAQPSISHARPQPKGLRMRYRPPGFGPGKLSAVGSGSESEAEEEDEKGGASFQFPKALGGHGPAKQNGGDPDVSMVDADGKGALHKSKKKKEKRKERHVRESQSQDDSVMATNLSLSPPSQVRHLTSNSPNPSDLKPTKWVASGVPMEEANHEDEKAKRKEEKRLKRERKEAKRKANEESQTA